MRGLGRFQRREHLLLGLGSTRLRSHRTRLGAAPGRFSLRQLRGHHFRVQSRDLPARQRGQRPCLPDQRLERAERVSSLPRRHRVPVTARRPRSVMETTRARITAEHPGPATPGHRDQVPAARPLAATLARLPAQGRAAESSTDSATTSVPSVMEIPFLSHQLFSSPGNERERRTASTPTVMQQAARASSILRPGRTAGSRRPPGKRNGGNHAGKHHRRPLRGIRHAGPVPPRQQARELAGAAPAKRAGNPAPASYRRGPDASPSRSRVTTARRRRRPSPSRTTPSPPPAASAPNASVASTATRPGIPSGNSTFKCGTPSTCRTA